MQDTVRSVTQRVVGGLSALFLVAALSLLAAEPALARSRGGSHGSSVRVVAVEHRGVVRANATATYSAQCPSSRPHPVGPEFGTLKASTPGSVALAASYPRARRGWVVVVENLTGQPQGYFVGIICLGANAKFAYPRTTFVAEPNGYELGGAECPDRSPHAINGYFGVQEPADLGDVLLAFTGPGHFKHEIDGAGVENRASSPVGLFAGAVCTSLRAESPTAEGVVAPGRVEGFQMSCPSRTPIAVSGAILAKAESDAGKIVMDESVPVTHRVWFVSVLSLTDHPVPFVAGPVCVG